MTAARSPVAVSVVIPALDEVDDIEGCIDSIGQQDLPLEDVEVILVDGCSTDGTVDAARRAAERHPFASFTVITNPQRRTASSLNAGMLVARGETIVRIDARSRVQPHYVRTARQVLAERPDVAAVGGAQVTRPRGDGPVAVGIARALRNRWATGMSRYRRGTRSGPSDTVWMGVFRAADLRAAGGWNDAVALNEDFELNTRLRHAGGVVWFESSLRSDYLPRRDLGALGRQYFYFGRVKGMWWARGSRPVPRQLALLAAPVAAATLLARLAGRHRVLAPVLGVASGLALLDAAGSDGPEADARGRAMACLSIATIDGAWWLGVWAGLLGEVLGVRHRHSG
jgi:glycosyltransferase involved in cell wall biosynthesis